MVAPLHPIEIYEIVAYFLVFVAVWRTRDSYRVDGSAFLTYLVIALPAFWWSFFVAIRLSLPGRFLRPRFSAPCCSWLPLPVSTSFRSDMERQAREEGES